MTVEQRSTGSGKNSRSNTKRRKWWLWALAGLLIVLLLAAGGFILWANLPSPPMQEAVAALTPDSRVNVEKKPWLVFEPTNSVPDTGLIVYPGARVDPRAYAPAARQLAEDGYLVAIAPMPLNLAIFSPGKASEIMEAYPQVRHWAVGGHSLGGAMAAQFAHDHPDQVDGLVLWAAYPPDGASLADWKGQVASIYGTRDGLATPAKIDASRRLLPSATKYVPIEGGDHAQFGWYGPQDGDNPATIERKDQQAQIVKGTEDLLKSIREHGGSGINSPSVFWNTLSTVKVQNVRLLALPRTMEI